MTKLRANQRALADGIYDVLRRGAKCALGVMATGGGKTVTMATMIRELAGRGVVQAHRAELVGQLSVALAREGVRHNITASKKTVKAIVNAHMEEFDRSYYDPRSTWEVASVDTIIRRENVHADKVDWVFTDEGHHVLRENKWGRAINMFPNARSVLMTATPTRADGNGLGSHHDGLVDAMVIGPGLRDLMSTGMLTGYKVYAPTVSDLDLSDVHITASGEYNQQEVSRAVRRSRKIVGDTIDNYKLLAFGKLTIVFAVDIEEAQKLTDAFNAQGIRAELVTGESEEADRRASMKRFKARETLVLVNVDLFGEGVDVPAVECVIMARPTASFSLYAQQIGRMLRLLISEVLMGAWDTFTDAQRLQFIAESDKPFGILIDQVGNVRREFNVGGVKYTGLPEGFSGWSTDRRGKRKSQPGDGIPMRPCLGCFKPYMRIFDACPRCGTKAPPPSNRGGPEFVDGDLYEISGDELARMRGQVVDIHGKFFPPASVAGNPLVVPAMIKAHHQRQVEQVHLRDAIALWAGHYPQHDERTLLKLFYLTFKVDVMTAGGLGAPEAVKLRERVNNAILEIPK